MKTMSYDFNSRSSLTLGALYPLGVLGGKNHRIRPRIRLNA